MSQNQQQEELQECPICFDPIDKTNNCVTTDCGHIFHCSCLMKNAVNNGFGCPMCRQQMAEEPEEDEEDEDEYGDNDSYESWNQVWSQLQEDNSLTSFRMFQQQLENEDVEEEPVQEPTPEPDLDQDEKPTPEYLAEKLAEKGITMTDMIKTLLLEHDEYESEFEVFDRRTSELYGEIRRLILHYNN